MDYPTFELLAVGFLTGCATMFLIWWCWERLHDGSGPPYGYS